MRVVDGAAELPGSGVRGVNHSQFSISLILINCSKFCKVVTHQKSSNYKRVYISTTAL